MTDNVCEDCGMWEVAHTDEHLAKVCLPARVRKLNLQIEKMKKWAEIQDKNIFKITKANIDMNRLNGEQQKVIEGCRDVFAQFCGESAPVIAHPPKCRFYIEGKQKDCNCTAKNTANDVLLSLKACREILSKTEKRKCEFLFNNLLPEGAHKCGHDLPCPFHP